MRAADLHRLARALREIALTSTGNTGADQVNAGELAVIEDVSRNPGATISDVTRRTGLAQSLVSRITHRMADAGVVRVRPDEKDRRKSRLEIEPSARAMFRTRADGSISSALAAHAPKLSAAQRKQLTHHLAEAERLLREGQE
ncbi:MarR family winged helix-turn-helix transcriptional regulator [Amycolatopsis sp. NPDC059090]|uniref:MarR family winged helix-turn-helix transcriptional regulator n=1 Tax=unclassified Amycolatopsis TaxID=2618356 RepID=UPI00366E23BA